MVIDMSLFSFSYMLISSYASTLFEYALFYIFCFFVKIQVFEGVWIDIRVFDLVRFVLLSVFNANTRLFSVLELRRTV